MPFYARTPINELGHGMKPEIPFVPLGLGARPRLTHGLAPVATSYRRVAAKFVLSRCNWDEILNSFRPDAITMRF
jgi:hypothetical protein